MLGAPILTNYTINEYNSTGKPVKSTSYDSADVKQAYSTLEYDENGNIKKLTGYDNTESIYTYFIIECEMI